MQVIIRWILSQGLQILTCMHWRLYETKFLPSQPFISASQLQLPTVRNEAECSHYIIRKDSLIIHIRNMPCVQDVK